MSIRIPGTFPTLALAGIDDESLDLSVLFSEHDALVLFGHRDCKTTRQTIPVLDRIHRRRTRGAVVLVLQDDAETARALAASLDLQVPIALEPSPYPLASALGLEVVPTLYLVERGGAIAATSVGFRRADLEAFAARLGVPAPLFAPEESVPAFRPG